MIVYKITNLFNKKAYIGITIRPFASRWYNHLYAAENGSSAIIHKAIRKYGASQFEVKTLYEATSEKELMTCEKGLIAAHGTMMPHGYNMTSGGEGFKKLDCRTGEEHPMAKLTESMVQFLREPKNATYSTRSLLKEFNINISPVACDNARIGKTWQTLNKTLPPISKFHIRENRENQKLLISDVAIIKSLIEIGKTQKSIGDIFGVTREAISGIKQGKNWKSIERTPLNIFLGAK
mgnify:CR=1 FL=1